MEIFTTITGLKSKLREYRFNGKTIGFVPTMGSLHEGHLSLIGRSKAENDICVCSIFVNPIQFNNKTDLEKYPRNLQSDQKMLSESDCDIVFAPNENEMYPEGNQEEFNINFGNIENVLEGKFRPEHFKGVAIVVKKLFEIVEPDRAYFGKKDYQQLLIIKEMVKILNLSVDIVPCPIIRELDGLAMSSRNLRLTIRERQEASQIFSVLLKVKEKIGTLPVSELKQWAIKKLQSNPLFQIEYLEITDKRTLKPLKSWKEKENGMVCVAVNVGDIRLIDNLEFF